MEGRTMELERPLPHPITPEARPYWDGLREHRLMLPRCRDCGKAFFYPRALCPFCHGAAVEWFQARGRGRLYSFEIAHQTMNKAFKVKPPYVLAMVELEEGPRLMSNLINVAPEAERDPLRHGGGGRLPPAHRRVHAAAVPAGGSGGRAMRELRNTACIVGVDESDELGTLPHKSQLTLHVEAVRNAVRDAGLLHRRRGRPLHRGPALAGHGGRGPGHHAPLRGRHHRRRLLVHHHGRPRPARLASRALRRGRRSATASPAARASGSPRGATPRSPGSTRCRLASAGPRRTSA